MPPCFVPDYLLESNNIWTVIDTVMTIGIVLIAIIFFLAPLCYLYDLLRRIRTRNADVIAFFAQYPWANLGIFEGYDPNHKNDIMQESLDPLNGIREAGLQEPYLTRALTSKTFVELNDSMAKQKSVSVDYPTFLAFVESRNGVVSADEQTMNDLYNYAISLSS